MKKLLITILTIIFSPAFLYAQDIVGSWNGALKITDKMQLRIVINISQTENGYKSTLDSPDQGVKGIPVNKTTFSDGILKFEVPAARIEYTGTLKDGKIVGTFTQNQKDFPLELVKGGIVLETPKRPQEPQKPFPYYSEDVTFSNPTANITLAGTLTLPQKEGIFPVAILISGSGPQNRDEELFNHKPFLVISDYLTRNGIAVLRFDDRGVGQSKGNFKTATSFDFANDVESAVAYLKTRKEIKQIGLIGHSEGGIIAPIVAARNKDVAFIVMLAGTGISGQKLLPIQQELISRVTGISEADIATTKELSEATFKIIAENDDDEKIKTGLTEYFANRLKNHPDEKPKDISDEAYASAKAKESMNPWPWMKVFLQYDPATSLAKVKCPVLAVNGDKDLQVPADINLSTIEKALKQGGNKDVTIKTYKNLNHLFQESDTGNPADYRTIEQTFSPLVLEDMSKWIKSKTGGK